MNKTLRKGLSECIGVAYFPVRAAPAPRVCARLLRLP